MLIYNPALDPYHCAIRLMSLALASEKLNVELTTDLARIGDYFLAYPAKLARFTLPNEFRGLRAKAKELENPYRNSAGDKIAFDRMHPIFFAALSGLVASGLVEVSAMKRGVVVRSEGEIPGAIAQAVADFTARQTEVGEFILSEFMKIPTSGNNGIKHRSGLLEHRYDIV
ncbi:ABC-three component system middle component 5 [Burkholderia plantarii]|uniref:Uncharacterized protein n=1 Tax=Burkholderia plantarii TaxID=41899 RepID=A0A0B6S255_BURPL|nr:ABC-three component system middle component 5 [Burkholderia plantarii]AJK47375.1 hypothetical protein BGL_1c28980 [Burkholderia plantarii]